MICTISETPYLVDGTLRVDTVVMITKRFTFDTGAGFNLIRSSAFPVGWEKKMYVKTPEIRLNDAARSSPALGESVWLTVRFGNTLHGVRFIVADRLAVKVLIGTAILNRHVIDILFTKQKMRFRHGDWLIVKKLTRGSGADLTPLHVRNWTKSATLEIEGEESLEANKKEKKEISEKERTRVRFFHKAVILPMSQICLESTTDESGLVVIEPQIGLKTNLSVTNGVTEVKT